MTDFPSMKARDLLAVLIREPLSYEITPPTRLTAGSPRLGRPSLTFAFHDRATVSLGLVRKVLCRDVGLAEDEALKLL